MPCRVQADPGTAEVARLAVIQTVERVSLAKPMPQDRQAGVSGVYLPNALSRKYPHAGKINFVSFQINPTTDSVLVRATLPNRKPEDAEDYDLIPGQYAPVRLIWGEDANTLLIPHAALVETQVGKQVFVVKTDNKVETRNVEVGRSYKNQWIIQKGLKKGEKVIVEGTQKVKPGVVVKPKPYTAKKAS